MSNFTQIEPCTTPDNCISNNITFQYNNNKNNNKNPDMNTQTHHQSYPGMVNRVCNVFGMKPEDYNTKLITETFYSNYLKKRRNLNDNDNTERCQQSFANNNAEKKRKYW